MRKRIHENDAAKTAAYAQRLKKDGGVRRSITLSGEAVKAIAKLRGEWGLKHDSEVIERALSLSASMAG